MNHTGRIVKAQRPCHCIRSKCVKLYCECFSSGVYCDGCSCMNCQNNIGNDDTRSGAMACILDRRPYAFRPKIADISERNSEVAEGSDNNALVVGRHRRGCNCSRTSCLKNYCECFKANISCCERCKCIGCRNAKFSNWVLAAPTPHVDYEKFEAYFDPPGVSVSTSVELVNECVTQKLKKRKLGSNKVPRSQNLSQELQGKLIVVDTSSPSHSAESSESPNRWHNDTETLEEDLCLQILFNHHTWKPYALRCLYYQKLQIFLLGLKSRAILLEQQGRDPR